MLYWFLLASVFFAVATILVELFVVVYRYMAQRLNILGSVQKFPAEWIPAGNPGAHEIRWRVVFKTIPAEIFFQWIVSFVFKTPNRVASRKSAGKILSGENSSARAAKSLWHSAGKYVLCGFISFDFAENIYICKHMEDTTFDIDYVLPPKGPRMRWTDDLEEHLMNCFQGQHLKCHTAKIDWNQITLAFNKESRCAPPATSTQLQSKWSEFKTEYNVYHRIVTFSGVGVDSKGSPVFCESVWDDIVKVSNFRNLNMVTDVS
jgi:hypothetical protein